MTIEAEPIAGAKEAFNAKLTAAGGATIKEDNDYWTSTVETHDVGQAACSFKFIDPVYYPAAYGVENPMLNFYARAITTY